MIGGFISSWANDGFIEAHAGYRMIGQSFGGSTYETSLANVPSATQLHRHVYTT